jgi:hypothetical protein
LSTTKLFPNGTQLVVVAMNNNFKITKMEEILNKWLNDPPKDKFDKELPKYTYHHLMEFAEHYLTLQLLQTDVIVSSLNKRWAIAREQAVKVAELNAIRHCFDLYVDLEYDENEIEKAHKRYKEN